MDSLWNHISAALWLVGGLALFLYGIELMSGSLRKAAGAALRGALNRITRTRFHGLAAGTIVTGLVQSSSATTVMAVGFISAGLLTFPQSIGIILGANIGTTITPQITAYDFDAFAVPLLGMGFVINFAARKRLLRRFGLSCMGFGMLFFGLNLMKGAVGSYDAVLQRWLDSCAGAGLAGGITAFLAAMLVTTIIQSSAAGIAMVQTLAVAGVIGDLRIAIPMIVGADIGTCVTAMLAALKAPLSARRAAVAHLVFNVIGAFVTLALFGGYARLIPLTSEHLPRQIANAHLAIKLVNVSLFLPFTELYARLIRLLMPGEDKLSAAPEYLDYGVAEDAKRSMKNIALEIRRMCEMGLETLDDAVSAFLDRDEARQELVLRRENLMDDLYRTVADYILKVSRRGVPPALSGRPPLLLHVLGDVERIGDHAENIVEMAEAFGRQEINLSEQAVAEIRGLQRGIAGLGTLVLRALDEAATVEKEILRAEEDIGSQVDRALDNHEARMAAGRCTAIGGMAFVELTINLKRVANHLRNAALSMIEQTPEHSRGRTVDRAG